MRPIITFTTDFTWSVAPGICRGVIKSICPEADIVDITHNIPSYDIEAGALAMLDAIRYLPTAIHMVVVDPGVGSVRRPVAIQTARGDVFVAPDNGVVMPAVDAAGGATAAWVIVNPAVILTPTSKTFHGRDIFAPAAAWLARGMALDQLGPAVDPLTLCRLDIPAARLDGDAISGMLLRFDPFGSGRTNVTGALLEELGLQPGDRVELWAGGETITMCFAATFSDVAMGEPLCLVDSSGFMEIAINQGSARDILGLKARTPIRLRRGGEAA